AILREISNVPEHSIPPALLRNAQGIAVIPNVVKVGFVVGGRFGRGVLIVRRSDDSWSAPAFITIKGGSIGWQIGAESTDVMLVFKTKRSIEGLIHGTFTLGASASVAAGPVGRQAAAATNAQLKAEIYSYSRSRGLFAGVALDGSAVDIDKAADTAFYGKPISAQDIFYGKKLPLGPAAVEFHKEVARSERG
uniref:lipid-binding SYLF domain-containing protein n=1 Tax=Acidithiobacillus sp. TaxID=1872118 RepID=UPI0031FF1B08